MADIEILGLYPDTPSAGQAQAKAAQSGDTYLLPRTTKVAVGAELLLYNLDTDASNYERGFLRWSSNLLYLGSEKSGAGTQRELDISGNKVRISVGGTGTTRQATFESDITYLRNYTAFGTLGTDANAVLRGAANGVLTLSANVGTNGAALEGFEMTAPSAPSANGYRIFAEDNGSGKTRLMVIFASGAAQQIAIEP